MGIGSAMFHPEASRVARMASGGRHGLAQSLFQVGGNVGSSLGPLIGAFLIVPRGQREHRVVLAAGAAGHGDPVASRQTGTRRGRPSERRNSASCTRATFDAIGTSRGRASHAARTSAGRWRFSRR